MTPAIRYLKQIGAEFKIHTYDCHVTDDFGKHCAEQLHMDENKIFKTLLIHHDKISATAIIPVNRRLNLKQAAKAAGMKNAEMMRPEDAERQTGYKVGGISPFAQKKQILTLLDSSAFQQETILVSGGKRGVSIEITGKDLLEILSGSLTAITD